MKNDWYQERKKLKLSEREFHIIIVLVALYSIVSTIIFAFSYFDSSSWKQIVANTGSTFPKQQRLSGDALENLTKVIYLVRFWGSLLAIWLIVLFGFIYSRKVKFGYIFPIAWLFVFIGLIVVNVALVRENTIILVFKTLSIIPISIFMLYILIDLYNYRRRLNLEYYQKIKKGRF